MRVLLSNLTAFLLVIHAMIGCCHHDWQSDSASTEPPSIARFAISCQCGNPCCAQHDQSEQPAQPCDGQCKCQGVCSYLPTPKTMVDASTAESAFDLVVVVPTLRNGQLANAGLTCNRAHTLNHSPPPLRLHLLNQILLI